MGCGSRGGMRLDTRTVILRKLLHLNCTSTGTMHGHATKGPSISDV